MANNDTKTVISNTLKDFESKPLRSAAMGLLKTLGYRSERGLELKPNNAKQFQAEFDSQKKLNSESALLKDWLSVDLLFQLTDAEIQAATQGMNNMFAAKKVDNTDIRSYLFFAVELKAEHYTRTQLAGITREINKLFPMPVLVIFKHGVTISISIIARRSSKKDENKDVLEKVTLIKDIRFHNNRPHIEILHDLSLSELAQQHTITNFLELQKAWEKTLDTNELNKKFYREIANWYFWAVKSVKFPKDAEKDEETRNATSVIRMITRLIFVWFIKEKGLVPEDLFDQRRLNEILNFTDPKKSTYYKAILQNLFFATLNTEMGAGRTFRRKNTGGLDPDYLMSNYYRYKEFFKNPETALKLFAGIPFLNGGLFECLDKEIEKGRVVRIDGFSDREDNPLQVPDDLFLLEKEKEIDLNEIYDTRNKKYKVRGIIPIFNSYKFTIEENTPIEEEVALDPELLGKVFENLLAAYNPETGTTARKQTGSFYTPREIVNYMVDEALIASLESKLPNTNDAQTKLRQLLAYTPDLPEFSEAERAELITAIDHVKVLDPACGSGAFPMGVLHKLVFLLAKLDPNNERWKEKQLSTAYKIPDAVARNAAIQSIEQVFTDNFDDYGRKLYLIENCIYGVDIQPIAVQIAKLRFFISLVVDQKTNQQHSNLGILPLPNLETKFVAANTLIGINRPDSKPADDTSASLSPEVEEACEMILRKLEQFLKSRNPDLRARYIQEAQEFADVINAGMGEDFQPLNADWLFNTLKDTAGLKALLPVKRETKASVLVLRNQEIEAKEKELEDVRRRHFSARTPKTKRQAREQDKRLREEIANLLSKNHALEDETAQQLAGWDPYNQNTHAEFFDSEWMFGLEDGFDVVIGNPPYIQLQANYGALANKYEDNKYQTFVRTGDIYCLFYEKGIKLLNMGGVLCYITSNSWERARYGDPLRKYLVGNSNPLVLINFDDAQMFEAVIVETNILLTQKSSFKRRCFAVSVASDYSLDTSLSEYAQAHFVILDELPASGWTIGDATALALKNKVERIGKKLVEWNIVINRGVTTGLNEAFIVSQETYEKLIKLDRNNKVHIKPALRGRDLRRYQYDFAGQWMIFVPWHFPLHKDASIDGSSTIAEKKFKQEYPSLYAHLLQYKEQLSSRNQAETGIRYEWYALQRCAASYWEDFEKPKIIWGELSDESKFTFDEAKHYLNNTIFMMTGDQLKYLLGILNSKAAKWYFEQISTTSGMGTNRWLRYKIEQLYVPIPTEGDSKTVEGLVNKILTAKRANPAADTSELERQIDELVYQLYGLTKEEIDIVENNV